MKQLLYTLCLLASTFPPSAAKSNLWTKEKPRHAYTFTQSVGVNTHFGYYDTRYALYEEVLKPRLIESGIKHIRDGTYNDDVLRKYRDIGMYGIRLLLITQSGKAVEQAKAIGSMLWGVEAVNEPDGGHRPGTWEKAARTEQQRLFENMRSDKATRHIPVTGLSLANIKDSPGLLGDLSPHMDYGGMHPYAAGQHPARHWGWGLPMKAAIDSARLVSKDTPLIVTECGYHNKVFNPNHPGVSEKAAAIYHLHLPFVYFNQGIIRSYKYEFLDLKPDDSFTDMECHFGLIRADGEPKPSFHALKNLLWILSDSETNFRTDPLTYRIDAPADAGLQHTLLQKTDGSWWLALFRTVSVYDLEQKKDIPVAPVSVTLTFKRKPASINVYRPNTGIGSIHSVKHRQQLTLDLGADLLLVEIKK